MHHYECVAPKRRIILSHVNCFVQTAFSLVNIKNTELKELLGFEPVNLS